MKKPLQQRNAKDRAMRGGKDRGQGKHVKSRRQEEDEIESGSSSEQPQEGLPPCRSVEKYQTPEALRTRLAREVISKVPERDNFFIQSAVQSAAQDQAVTAGFKREYMAKQNKLYDSLSSWISRTVVGEPVEYRGHTKCITGFQFTQHNIYSCSKDRSIIKWDRQTAKKEFISRGETVNDHKGDILCLSVHSNGNVLATAGEDMVIKLWDVRTIAPIETLKGHKNHINCIKFGIQSNTLCSGSSDLTVKQWDWSQRGLLETFFEHNAEVLDMSAINANDFLTSGNDHQAILWKTEKETKVVFKGHDYAIDRVAAINHERFITASQDGYINVFFMKKSKPLLKVEAHKTGWIGGLDTIRQSNVFATGGIDKLLKVWAIEDEGVRVVHQLPMKGIVTNIRISQQQVAATECDQHRLGRWVTQKCRNKIKVFPFRQP